MNDNTRTVSNTKFNVAERDGLSTIIVDVSGDHYLGEPKFRVWVNGEIASDTFVVSASRALEQNEQFQVRGDFGANGPTNVSIEFLNDRYDSASQDRNLVVNSIEVNGKAFEAGDASYRRGYDGKELAGHAVMAWSGQLVLDTSNVGGPNWIEGDEDSAIALNLDIPGEADGFAVNELTVSGVPAEAKLSAGTRNEDGSWTLGVDDAADLTITPGENSSDDFNLDITARGVNTETDEAQQETVPVFVRVNPVADVAAIAISSASGTEDTGIAMDFTPALTDHDGSEVVDSIVVGGMPGGSSFTAGRLREDGKWELEADDLEGLELMTAKNSDENFSLDVAVTTREQDSESRSTTVHNVAVDVNAVADGVAIKTPDELSIIRVRLSGEGFDSINDRFDGPPEFRVLVNGEATGPVHKANASYAEGEWEIFSITGDYGDTGPQTVEVEFTNDLWCKPNCADRNLIVDWIEVNGHVYQSETDSRYLRYEIAADAGTEHCDEFGNPIDPGNEVATGYQAQTWMSARERMNWEGRLVFATADNGGPAGARGDEDSPIAIVFDMSLIDSDGSEKIREIIVSNIPAGAALSAGVDRGNGEWSLSEAELEGLTVTAPQDSDQDFDLNFTFNTTETANGDTRSQDFVVPVTVDAVADAPVVSAEDVRGTEGQPVKLSLDAAITDIDRSEALTLILTGVPAGSTLSHGVSNEDGTWTVDGSEIGDVVLTPPANTSGEVIIGVTAVATEAENGDQATTQTNFKITLDGVAGEPVVTIEHAAGLEDNAIELNIDAYSADPNEVVTILVADVPEGATLSAGTRNEAGNWFLAAHELEGLTITPPLHSDEPFDLKVEVISTQKDTGDTASKVSTLSVAVGAVADAPAFIHDNGDGLTSSIRLTVSGQHYKGAPDYQIFINGEQYGDTYTVEADFANNETETLEITGQFGLDGPASVEVKFLNDRWEGPGKDRNLVVHELEVNGTSYDSMSAQFIRGADGKVFTGMKKMWWTGSLQFDTTDNAGTGGARGYEDQPIDLALTAALVDIDGSERIESVVIGNLPEGAMLSTGVDNGNGTWTLTSDQFANATITAPADSNEDMMLVVTATSVESSGERASTTIDLPVRVTGVADAPTLVTEDAVGTEDLPVAINFGGALTDLDGSETLSFIVDHVPEGASLNQGVANEDGSWSLTEDDLEGLMITPPQNFSGEIVLGVSAVSTENDGDVATTAGSLVVSIDAVADAALITRKTARGLEDGQVPLSISISPSDKDGSERVGSVVLSGLPEGSTLSAGIDNGDGSWTLSEEELVGLTLAPPLHSNQDFSIRITAETIESNGSTRSTSRNMSVKLTGVADAPVVNALDTNGEEDQPIDLELNAGLVDTDGSETLSVLIKGVPAGSVLSAGTEISSGVWSVAPESLADLTLTPPRHFSGRIDLEMDAAATESDGDAAHSAVPFSLYVKGVADRAHLDIRPAEGLEDNAIALDIRSSLIDSDGSETLSFVIAEVPGGAKLSAGRQNGDGTWSLSAADVAGLTITPPKDSNEDFSLAVTAVTTEADGDTSTITLALPVKVTGVADTPVATVGETRGDEDTAIALNIGAEVADIDGSEQVSVVLGGLPRGARLSHGLYNGNGTWSIDPADLPSLTMTPPRDFSGNVEMSLRVISTENDGDSTSTSRTFNVQVDGVVDTPGGLSNTLVLEDTSVEIDIVPRTTDIDGSETVVGAIVRGVPVGARLSAGTEIESGVWQVSPGDFDGLRVHPGYNSNVDFRLTVESTVEEADGTTATFDRSMNVNVIGDADTPDVWAYDVSGKSDTPIALDFGGQLNDLDGSETLYFIIEDIPKGMHFNKGFNNGDGTWTVPEAHLEGLTGTSPFHYKGELHLTVRAVSRENDGDIASNTTTFVMDVDRTTGPGDFYFFGLEDNYIGFDISKLEERGARQVVISDVPADVEFSAGTRGEDGTWTVDIEDTADLALIPSKDSDDDMRLKFSWIDEHGNEGTSGALVEVLGVADMPDVELSTEGGDEDTPISITVTGEIFDLDGSEKLSFVVKDLPEGATLSAGYLNPISGVWTLTPEDMEGLTVTPPEDFSGDMDFTVGAVATEQSGDYAVNLKPANVYVVPVADEAEIGGVPEVGVEDTALDLNLMVETTDEDGSEKVVAVNISGLPAGATLINATDNGDGTWEVDPTALDTVQIVPPQHAHGAFNVTVNATTEEPNGDQAVTSSKVSFSVASNPDQPTVVASDVQGVEDDSVALNLSANLVDTDGSEVMSVRIDGIPDGATLSTGFNNGDGTWTVTGDQLNGLSLNPPEDFSGEIEMGITGISMEMDTGETAQTPTVPFSVTVLGIADAPTVDPQSAYGIEDNAIPVLLNASLVDADGSETLSAVFSDYPEGAVFSSGQMGADGWEVAGEDLDGLTVTPPANSSDDFDMSVTVVSTEATGDQARTDTTVRVRVEAAADDADVTANDVSGEEDTAIALDLAARLSDDDGSETLSAIVTGVPEGGSLSHGTQRVDGGWNVNSADLALVTMMTPENFSGVVEMTLITTTVESSNDSQVVNTKRFEVDVAGVADAPVVSAQDVEGESNSEIALNIQAELTDLDGSEQLDVVVTGLPDDATLSAGSRNEDGSWTVARSDLSTLKVTAAEDFVGELNLNVEAVATEDSGDVATASTTLKVAVTETQQFRAADSASAVDSMEMHAASSTTAPAVASSTDVIETEVETEEATDDTTEDAIVDAMLENDAPATSSNWTEDIDANDSAQEPRVEAHADPLADEALTPADDAATAQETADPLAAEGVAVESGETSVDDALVVPTDI